MYRNSSNLHLNDDQKAIHKAWLEESIIDHRARMAQQKQDRVNEVEHEKERLKQNSQGEKIYKDYVKDTKQRQKEIMDKVNRAIIESHAISKNQYKLEKRNAWGDNRFFEKLWMEKKVNELLTRNHINLSETIIGVS